MNNKLVTINPHLVQKPLIAKPNSVRNMHSIDSSSKPLPSKLKPIQISNYPQINIRILNSNNPQKEDIQNDYNFPKSTVNLLNSKEVLKRLSSNKASSKAIRRPSEEICSEHSNKNTLKAPILKSQIYENLHEKNSKQLPSKTVQNMQKLIALGYVPKNSQLKQNIAKQNIFFEARKPTINFKGLFQQLKNNQNLAKNTKKSEKTISDVTTKDKIGFENSNTTASTRHAAFKSKRMKTEICDVNIQEENNDFDEYGKRDINKKNKFSDQQISSFSINEKSIEDAQRGKQKGLKCEESIPNLKKKFVLNNNSSVSDISLNNKDEYNSNSVEKYHKENSEIVNFVQDNFENNFEIETLSYLIEQEEIYAPDPNYMENCQSHLKWKMRSILLDWMQEVCSDYLLKRETFYYAANYVDRYLSCTPNIEKKSLQLLGLTCLYLAAKVEEVLLPKVENMVLAANNTYSASQIIKMETSLYFALKFKVTPPTLNMWANWYSSQWDNFINDSQYAQSNVLVNSVKTPIRFKLPTQQSYTLYRYLMQLLDATILEVQTLQYKQRALVLSVMYVLIGREFKQFTTDMIVNEFPNSSQYLLDNSFAYNNLFGHFVRECFGIELLNLLPTIQYASSFFSIDFDISLPIAAKIDKENVLQVY